MSEELKPCPFCGGGARLDQRVTQSLWNSSDAVFSHVSCDDCDIQGQDFCDDPDGSEAIEWWNTRAAHPAPDAEAVEVVAVAFITRAEKSGPKIAITLKKEAAEQQHKNWLSMSKTITTEPLMTVAQHNRIMAATVPAGSRVLQAGEVAVSSDQIARMADDLAYAIYNLAGSRVGDLSPGVVESTCPAITALIVERNLRALLEVKS